MKKSSYYGKTSSSEKLKDIIVRSNLHGRIVEDEKLYI
jgi:hypothetical protein